MTDAQGFATSPDTSAAPQSEAAAPTDRPKSKTRGVFACLLGILAVIGLFATTVAVWAKATLFNSDKVAAVVDEAMQKPEVNAAMAAYLTDQLFTMVDVNSRVESILPGPLQALEPAIVGGAHNVVEGRVEKLLSRDEVRKVIVGLVHNAHAALVKLLQGDGLSHGVSVTDGQVSVNLLPLVSRGLLAVQGLGLFDNKDIPTLTADGDPAQQIAQLEKAFGRDLPANFGQLVVYQSARLASAEQTVNSAQQVLVSIKRTSWAIAILTVILLVGSVLLAQRRRRAIVALALGGVAVMLLARMLVQRVVAKAPQLVIDPGARAAVATAVTQLSTGLLRLTTVVVVVGLLTAAIAFVTGPSDRALALRRRVGASNTTFRAFAVAHRDGVAAVAFGCAVLVLVVLGISILSVVLAVLLAIVGGWALWGPQPSPTAE